MQNCPVGVYVSIVNVKGALQQLSEGEKGGRWLMMDIYVGVGFSHNDRNK